MQEQLQIDLRNHLASYHRGYDEDLNLRDKNSKSTGNVIILF